MKGRTELYVRYGCTIVLGNRLKLLIIFQDSPSCSSELEIEISWKSMKIANTQLRYSIDTIGFRILLFV